MDITVNGGIEAWPVTVCPLCAKPGVVKYEDVVDGAYGTPGVWNYRECSDCRWVWVDPKPDDESIPKLYESYYTHSGEVPGRRWAALRDQMLERVWEKRYKYSGFRKHGFLAKCLSNLPLVTDAASAKVMYLGNQVDGKLLDVGCGSGVFLERMRTLGWDVEGTEPDPKAAEVAEERGIKVFPDLNACRAQRSSYYSAITMHHVIEHLPSPLKDMERCLELLAPGGVMVIVTPNIYSLGSLVFGKHWRSLEPPRHLHVFGERAIRYAMEKSGFSSVSSWTSARLARLTWPASRLLKAGQRNVEQKNVGRRLQLEAILFWVTEALVNALKPVGEELVCIGRKAKTDE